MKITGMKISITGLGVGLIGLLVAVLLALALVIITLMWIGPSLRSLLVSEMVSYFWVSS